MQIRHLPPLLRFIPQFAQICIVFALSKFEANPFFRPVSYLVHEQKTECKRMHQNAPEEKFNQASPFCSAEVPMET